MKCLQFCQLNPFPRAAPPLPLFSKRKAFELSTLPRRVPLQHGNPLPRHKHAVGGGFCCHAPLRNPTPAPTYWGPPFWSVCAPSLDRRFGLGGSSRKRRFGTQDLIFTLARPIMSKRGLHGLRHTSILAETVKNSSRTVRLRGSHLLAQNQALKRIC